MRPLAGAAEEPAILSATYRFRPGLSLRVRGGRDDLRHVDAEYRDARQREADAGDGGADGEAEVLVTFERGPGGSRLAELPTIRGRRKTTWWHATLGSPAGNPLTATVRARGIFARPFVQSYVVEPLLSVAASRAGLVQLPAAAIECASGLLLIVGGSATGKTTLAARAIAAGRRVVGDDQVLLDADGRAWPFPRRMRLYPDLWRTAPNAHRRLPIRTRGQLLRNALLSRLSGRLVRLPVLTPATEFDATPAAADRASAGTAASVPVAHIVVVERCRGVASMQCARLGDEETIRIALDVLAHQRRRLQDASPAWAAAVEGSTRREGAILEQALAGIPAERLVLPDAWAARRAIDALDERLGISR